ncbi:MAG: toxin-antitoxin system YwqK family antitoxin [Pirellulales bacterium]
MATWRTIKALAAVAMLALAGCGSGSESSTEGEAAASGDEQKAAVAQLGDGTEPYHYIAPKKKQANSGLVEVKPIKAGEQKFTYPPQSSTPEVVADITVFSDKSFVFDGKFEEFRSDGKTPHAVGEFKDDHREGKWIYYHPNGKVAKEVHYVNGLLDGEWTHYNEDGTKTLEAAYKNGKRHGTWTNYAPPGEDGKQPVVQTSQFVDGLFDGPTIQFYSDGKKRLEQNFKAGLPQGTKAQWFASGAKFYEADFDKGKKNGMETYWDEQGKVLRKREFHDGAPVRPAADASSATASTK